MCQKDTTRSPRSGSSESGTALSRTVLITTSLLVAGISVWLAATANSPTSVIHRTRRRLALSARAFYSLATMPAADWNAYYKSIDQVMTKGKIESQEDERLVGAWYRVVNYFCDLGNLEKMYIPPLVDPSNMALEANQILIENKMVFSAASGFWNASSVNAAGTFLPERYKNRYILHLESGNRSILPAEHDTTPVPPEGFTVREMDILDLGCGKGRVLHDMILYTGGKGKGINIDDSQLQNGLKFAHDQNLWPHRLDLQYGSFNDKLPFSDESHDFVYEIGAFTYLMDKQAVFDEIYRVLRPGGAFCYNDWTILEKFQAGDQVQAEKLLQIRKFSGLIELHRPKELAAIAEKAGFEVVWNGHGGHNAIPSSGLLSNMEDSFWYADLVMNFLIKYSLLPKNLVKAWDMVRAAGGVFTLKEAMDEQWLDVGHIFLIRKPL